MLAFEACGSNLFQDFAWSTDGHRLYFLLGMTHHVMDASARDKATKVVPVPTPVGTVAWVSATRLVLPVAAASDAPPGSPPRLVVFDAETDAVFAVDLPGMRDPTDLHRSGTPNRVLFTAIEDKDPAGVRKVFEADLGTGQLIEAFPWLGPVDRFTYSAAGNGVVATNGETVTLYDASTGTKRGLWAPAHRGVLHPGGQWLMLEHTGEPVSVFQPTGIEELAEADREAALAKAKKRGDELPSGFQRTIRPPMLSFVDLTTGKRYLVTSVQGTKFQWYETKDFYGSFVSWGFEQKQFRHNVLLGDFAKRLLAAADGRKMLGVRPLGTGAGEGEAAEGEAAAPAPPEGSP
jgi:hypothetical protein